jgi:hypothetical protein
VYLSVTEFRRPLFSFSVTEIMPATLLRIAGKFTPPTIAVLYEDRRGARKLYEMPLPEAAADLTAAEVAAELAREHPSVFAALTIPEGKLLAAIDRVLDGAERKNLEAIEAAQREIAERLAAVTGERCEAGGAGERCEAGGAGERCEAGGAGERSEVEPEPEVTAELSEPDDALLPDPLSDEAEDLLRKSISSVCSRASRGSRGSGGRYGGALCGAPWARVDASADSAFEWVRCMDEPDADDLLL